MDSSIMVVVTLSFVLLLGGLVIYWSNRVAGDRSDLRFQNAIQATARVIEVGTSIVGKSDTRISAALRFEVVPPGGRPYKARSPWIIEPAHIAQIRVGESFPVKIDQKERNVIFPDLAWARYDWERYGELEPLYED